MNKTVGDIMTADILTLNRNDTLSYAANIMHDNDLGFLPVVENGEVVGVVTDRDLAVRGYADGLAPDSQVQRVMTESCITAEKSTSLDDAADIMAKNQIRRLVVLDGGKIAGICALGDISLCGESKNNVGMALSEISEPTHNYASY